MSSEILVLHRTITHRQNLHNLLSWKRFRMNVKDRASRIRCNMDVNNYHGRRASKAGKPRKRCE
jgi:hypothetical protein